MRVCQGLASLTIAVASALVMIRARMLPDHDFASTSDVQLCTQHVQPNGPFTKQFTRQVLLLAKRLKRRGLQPCSRGGLASFVHYREVVSCARPWEVCSCELVLLRQSSRF